MNSRQSCTRLGPLKAGLPTELHGRGRGKSRSTYVAVLLLDELEEGRHVRAAEMVDGPEAGEHAPAVQTLEVVLHNVLETK